MQRDTTTSPNTEPSSNWSPFRLLPAVLVGEILDYVLFNTRTIAKTQQRRRHRRQVSPNATMTVPPTRPETWHDLTPTALFVKCKEPRFRDVSPLWIPTNIADFQDVVSSTEDIERGEPVADIAGKIIDVFRREKCFGTIRWGFFHPHPVTITHKTQSGSIYYET